MLIQELIAGKLLPAPDAQKQFDIKAEEIVVNTHPPTSPIKKSQEIFKLHQKFLISMAPREISCRQDNFKIFKQSLDILPSINI